MGLGGRIMAKKTFCLRCQLIERGEKLVLRALKAKRPNIGKIGETVTVLAQLEDGACKCGRRLIVGERVGSLVDHVHNT